MIKSQRFSIPRPKWAAEENTAKSVLNVLASEPERRLPRERQGPAPDYCPKTHWKARVEGLIKCNNSAIISQSDYLLIRENGLKHGKAIL